MREVNLPFQNFKNPNFTNFIIRSIPMGFTETFHIIEKETMKKVSFTLGWSIKLISLILIIVYAVFSTNNGAISFELYLLLLIYLSNIS